MISLLYKTDHRLIIIPFSGFAPDLLLLCATGASQPSAVSDDILSPEKPYRLVLADHHRLRVLENLSAAIEQLKREKGGKGATYVDDLNGIVSMVVYLDIFYDKA